jgi:hypothetical protein
MRTRDTVSKSPFEPLARVEQLLRVSRKLLAVCEECKFADLADVESKLLAEIKKLKTLREMARRAA